MYTAVGAAATGEMDDDGRAGSSRRPGSGEVERVCSDEDERGSSGYFPRV